ncbi:DUF3298 and DUF4163 domain-containing protein [Cellulophaga baltica]|uniref:Deacetylase PdaC domain-containing protein n=1 Tax=Cellulophaga baltica TaxID=76594 RepID=A0A1G7F6A3_9FLAO|nr:DUF3298 and DUF4163 domain-containing protein [Cellulophaga baltica]SDE71430.1 Protein of unknown function [Cellulophaga baltica]
MKLKLTILIFSLVVLGCKKKDELTLAPLNYKSENCADCPEVLIEIFEFKDDTDLSKNINASLKKEVINELLYDDEVKVATVEEAISSFKEGYLDLKKMYPEETLSWEATIKGDIIFENKDILTIKLETYIFTGGAHGYSATRLLNFDKKKGDQLENWQLIKDKDRFTHLAEIKFKIQEDIPQNGYINSTGFMFENDIFYLPNNMGFTEKGLLLIYNQYEVASYADGPIKLVLPYDEIKNYITVKIKKEK